MTHTCKEGCIACKPRSALFQLSYLVMASCRFVGKAAFNLDEYSQAEIAYRKASDQDGANPLAWQGLAELHIKTGRTQNIIPTTV